MAATAEAVRSDTSSRILDAAFEAVATFGLSRLTVDDVARLAGLSRQTVYRYFDSRDALVVALVAREEEAFLEGVREAHARHPDLEEAMREAVLFCLRTAREHPLLDRLLASEPEVLLPYLTTRAGPVVARAREVIEELAAERTGVRSGLVHRTADVAVRAIVSYALTPSEDRPEDVAGELARILASALEVREEDVR
ncbi:MAG: TetR/AcrR family transcriptional regulator [Actinomycetota bacterium]